LNTKALLAIVALFPAMVLAQTICIDPGHPSEVGKGSSGKKISELEAVWLIGSRVAKRLEELGYRVVMTKTKQEELVKNRRRAEIANESKADLMVRLHCDGAGSTGFAVYWPSKQGTAQGRTGPSQEVIERTSKLVPVFHKELAAALKGKLRDNGLKGDEKTLIGSRQGALTGSIFSEVPVLLVEMVDLTNPSDDAFIASRAGQDLYVEALVRAINKSVPLKKGE
jgi:N-acetylmuramoyl-L-alanine amidase